jgi:hypothetical protein
VPKPRLSDKRPERLTATATAQTSGRTSPREIRDDHLRSCHETRLNELRLQYLSGTYFVPATEISVSVIEKHLKR